MKKFIEAAPEGFAKLPTQEHLHECFVYDASTGKLFWKERPLHHFQNSPERSAKWKQSYTSSRFAGKEALTADNGMGHKGGMFDGTKVYAHRVIWKMEYGAEPKTIDHINGNPSDNRLSNLRSVTHQENLRNTKLSKKNKTGVKGVSFHATSGFQARISDRDGRDVNKWFRTKAEAAEWRLAKEREFGYFDRSAA